MLAISRFRYDDNAAAAAAADLTRCLDELRRCPGFLAGAVGRAIDDPELWVLQTRWGSVGAYRRALSSYNIKMSTVPLLANAVDEPSAFEIVVGDGATKPNESRPRGAIT